MLYYLQVLCVLYTLGFILSIVVTMIKHRHYISLLLFSSPTTKFRRRRRKKFQCVCGNVYVIYRMNYFGYSLFNVFGVRGLEKVDLTPDDKMRVYGYVSQNKPCLLYTNGRIVKTVIALDDTRYGYKVLEFLQRFYKYVLIVITLGVFVWFIGLRYLI